MKCPNCSNEVPETANVCGYCGNRLRSATPPPQPEVRQAQPASGGIPGWMWGLGGLVLVGGIILVAGIVLMSSTGLFAPISDNQSNQPTETSEPIQVVITATRIDPSPTRPASQETGWVPVVEDDFSDSDSPWWGETREQDYSAYIEGGTYHIKVDISNTYYWMPLSWDDGSDVALEVHARIMGGADDSSMGVTCRQSGQNYYFFQVNNLGEARISKYAEASGWDYLTEWEQIPTYQPNDWNLIYAQCQEDELILEVNNEPVTTVYDSTFSRGSVGLVGGAKDTPGAHVEFDNFELWEYR